jgi:hypothetical protein
MVQLKIAFFLVFFLLNTHVLSQNREINYFKNISFDSLVELRRGDSLAYVKELKLLRPQSSFALVDSFFNKILLSKLWGSFENYVYSETLIVTLNAIEGNISRDSTNRRFWLFVRRGFCRYIHSDYALSMVDLNLAIKEKPENPYPYYFRGLVKYERKDYYGAIEDLKYSVFSRP